VGEVNVLAPAISEPDTLKVSSWTTSPVRLAAPGTGVGLFAGELGLALCAEAEATSSEPRIISVEKDRAKDRSEVGRRLGMVAAFIW
jgi:hypothetical protein